MSFAYNESEEKVLSLMPHITGALSILGSLSIIGHIFSNHYRNSSRIQVHQRILIALSMSDMMSSIGFFLSTWPIPRNEDEEDPVFGSFGNENSCRIQGFLVQLSIMTPLYNVGLATHYLLVVKYKVTEEIMRRNIEPWMHSIPIVWGFGSAMIGLVLDLYHNAFLWCWIAKPSTGENNWKLLRWLFYYGPLWVSILIISIIMWVLYAYVVRQETEVVRYLSRKSREKRITDSRKIANQSMFYVACFYVTWIPATINRIFNEVNMTSPFAVLLLHAIFAPGQGFLNFVVYARPKYLRYREQKHKTNHYKRQQPVHENRVLENNPSSQEYQCDDSAELCQNPSNMIAKCNCLSNETTK